MAAVLATVRPAAFLDREVVIEVRREEAKVTETSFGRLGDSTAMLGLKLDLKLEGFTNNRRMAIRGTVVQTQLSQIVLRPLLGSWRALSA